jgi:hypothetical protein
MSKIIKVLSWIFHYEPSSYWVIPIYGNPQLLKPLGEAIATSAVIPVSSQLTNMFQRG